MNGGSVAELEPPGPAISHLFVVSSEKTGRELRDKISSATRQILHFDPSILEQRYPCRTSGPVTEYQMFPCEEATHYTITVRDEGDVYYTLISSPYLESEAT